MLRWEGPVIHFRRTASRDVELRGQPIRQGDKVVVFYPSANRDNDVFDRPDDFDITRDPNPTSPSAWAPICAWGSAWLAPSSVSSLRSPAAPRPGRAPCHL
ncbi:MAG: cytochrome P450 [Actinomycetota bacterium]